MNRDKIDWDAVGRAADRLAEVPSIPDTQLAAVFADAGVLFESRGCGRAAKLAAWSRLKEAGCEPEMRARRARGSGK